MHYFCPMKIRAISPKAACSLFFLLVLVNSISAQKTKPNKDSLAIRDSIREMMYRGAMLSMDALQSKYESQKTTDPGVKKQKSGESQNLFFQSRAYYRKAIAFDKNYAPAWNSMGTTYFLQDLPKASLPCYHKAILINGNYSSAWYNLGKSYLALKLNDSAEYSFRQSIRSDSTFIQAYQELSQLLFMKKDSIEAFRLLQLSAYYNQDSEVPWVTMAAVYFSYKDSASGISALERAAAIYPGDLDRLQFLADYYKRKGDKRKADYFADLFVSEKKKQEFDRDPADENK